MLNLKNNLLPSVQYRFWMPYHTNGICVSVLGELNLYEATRLRRRRRRRRSLYFIQIHSHQNFSSNTLRALGVGENFPQIWHFCGSDVWMSIWVFSLYPSLSHVPHIPHCTGGLATFSSWIRLCEFSATSLRNILAQTSQIRGADSCLNRMCMLRLFLNTKLRMQRIKTIIK